MRIEIEIGDNLYLVIGDVSYEPEEKMVMYYADGSGHPGSAAEVYWNDEDCRLEKDIIGKDRKPTRLDFNCPIGLANEYYDDILEAMENELCRL